MKLIVIVMFMSFGFISCKDQSFAKQTTPSTKEVINKNKASSSLNYPSITIDILQKLFNESDYMDYILNDVNFSISQNEKKSIQSSIRFISSEVPANIPQDCKILGRKFFHVNGEIILEADVYFSKSCAFYIFFEDNKPKYANKMTQEGVNFYTNILRSGQKQEEKLHSDN